MRYKVVLARRVYEYAELTINAEDEQGAEAEACRLAPQCARWAGDDPDDEYPPHAISCEAVIDANG